MNAPSSTKPVIVAIAHFFEASSDKSRKSTMLMPATNTSSGASACQSIVGAIQSLDCANSVEANERNISPVFLRVD